MQRIGKSSLRSASLTMLAIAAFLAAGCKQQAPETPPPPKAPEAPAAPAAPAPEPKQPSEIVLASTTSTQDSGLFDVLIPAFEKANPGYKVKVVAVGTGEALKLGENKDADVLLVHAKADEEKFVAAGHGTARRDVMYNDFMIVGPPSDPAKVGQTKSIDEAMKAIQKAGQAGKATFVSRGDDSGTHKKELKLWKAVNVTPDPKKDRWYLSTGQGMGETLTITSEKQAYTLADRATFLSMEKSLNLKIDREKDPDLLNQYGVIVVTGAKNQRGGQVFADWIVSSEGQKVIGDFGVQKHGQQLFVPNATQQQPTPPTGG